MEGPQHRDEIGEIVLKLSDIVDIAITSEMAVASHDRYVNRRAGIAQRLGERMHAAAVIRRAMNEEHNLRPAPFVNPDSSSLVPSRAA